MLRNDRKQLTRSLLSVAISLFVVEGITPSAIAEMTQYQVATVVVIEDITAAMALTSFASGGGMVNVNGTESISADGSQFTLSFTAGSIVFADTGTFSPDGVAPGTGTWSISTTQNSTISMSGSQTVSYDSGTANYTGNTTYNFNIVPPKDIFPPLMPPNDQEIKWMYEPSDTGYICTDTKYWTYNDKRIPGWNSYSVGYPSSSSVGPMPWNQMVGSQTSGESGYVSGDFGSGAFTGSYALVPEPSSVVLAAIGAVGVIAFASSHKRRSKRRRGTGGQSGSKE